MAHELTGQSSRRTKENQTRRAIWEPMVDPTLPAQRLRRVNAHSHSLNSGACQLDINTDRTSMAQASTIPDSFLESVERAFARAAGEWTGCDWPTSFGNKGLDLNGMTSYQAILLARATAGVEA